MKRGESKLEHAGETTRSVPIPHFIVSLAIALVVGMIISGWLPKNQEAIQVLDGAYNLALTEAKQLAEDEAASRIAVMQDTLSETEDEIRQEGYQDGYTEGRCDGLQEAYDEYEGLPDKLEECKGCIASFVELLDSYDETWRDQYGGPDYDPFLPVQEPTASVFPAHTSAPSVNMVWIPTRGGTKYHSNSSCSKMKDPQEVTLEEAESMGFTPCGKCY